MNIANIMLVADAIERKTVATFDMSNWAIDLLDAEENTCGTAACIAGHAYLMSGSRVGALGFIADTFDVVAAASKFLGINNEIAWPLFVPSDYVGIALSDITAKHAVRCLRNLAITGKVDWAKAMQDDEPELPAVPTNTKIEESA